MKVEVIQVKYGISDAIGSRYMITTNGHSPSSGRTFKSEKTALIKSLEFAKLCYKNHYEPFNGTQYNYEFIAEPNGQASWTK